MTISIEILAKIAQEAGALILQAKGCSHRLKADYSPVTEADLSSNTHIEQELTAFYPHIPLLSEENEACLATDTFFCIDPLDGTKEFIAENGEYCVCIAYIEKGIAVQSVIYAPETGDLFCADKTAYHIHKNGIITPLNTQKNTRVALISRSHFEVDLQILFENEGITSFLTCGSALKFTLLARGKADLYARFTALSIWDIAAGDALVRAAGGTMTDHEGNCLTYHSSQLRAKGFIARA